MRVSVSRSSGRADPFGLLILAVMLALSVTIGIQAQSSAPDRQVRLASDRICISPCTTGGRHN